jgi:archaemetzincin
VKVALVPVGNVPREMLRGLADGLAAYGIVGELRDPIAIADEIVDNERGQLRAEALLDVVAARGATLAVTDRDMYEEGRAFVFGLANIGAPGAVVSTHRLAALDRGRFLQRLTKEAVHELGHTWGLDHCLAAGCVMRSSESVAEVDAKGDAFCERCRPRLPAGVVNGPASTRTCR